MVGGLRRANCYIRPRSQSTSDSNSAHWGCSRRAIIEYQRNWIVATKRSCSRHQGPCHVTRIIHPIDAIRRTSQGDAVGRVPHTFCKIRNHFRILHEPIADFTLLYTSIETFAPEWGIIVLEVTEMMYARPSLIRLSLPALPCSATFAQRANERQGYAPASEKNRRL
jgi:hypothetical protein